MVLSVLSGCGPVASPDRVTYHTDTLPNGRVHLENTGAPAWSSDERWEAEEVLRIGTLDGEGPDQFGAVSGLAVSEEGSVFVGEYYSNEIRVFTSSGSHSHTFGTQGAGPGEFNGIFGMRFAVGGELWVRDAGNNRFSVFSPDGSLVRSFSPGFFSRNTPWQLRILSGDRFLDWDIRRPHDPDAENRTDLVYFPVISPFDLSFRDTLPPIVSRMEMIDGMRVPKPFSASLEYFVDESGVIWLGNSTEYRIIRRGLDGDTTLIFTLPWEPETVSEQEKIDLVDGWLPGRKIPAGQILEEKPVLARIIADDRGHVLVFPHLNGVSPGTAVDVFTEAGVFLGRVALPVPLDLRPEPICQGGKLFGITRDDLDVPVMVQEKLDFSGV